MARGWQEEDESRLYLEQSTSSEGLGHIQGYCKALQKLRIEVHHGI